MTTKKEPEAGAAAAGHDSTALTRPTTTHHGGSMSRATTMASSFHGLMPTSLGEAFQLAGYLAKSEVVPKAMQGKPDTVLTVIMTGLEIGLSPMHAINNVSIISGNLTFKADLMLALVRNSGLLAFWDEGFDAAKGGWCEVARKGDNGEDGKPRRRRYEFTIEMAKAKRVKEYGSEMPLSEKGTYKQWPERMYPKRARSWALQEVFGDVLKGLYATEDLEGGQIIDADLPATSVAGPGPDELVRRMHREAPEIAEQIERGFETLNMRNGKRLQKLLEYSQPGSGGWEALLEWQRGEFAARKGKGYTPKAKESSAPAPKGDTRQQGSQAAAAPATTQAVVDGEVVEDDEPAAQSDVDRQLDEISRSVFGHDAGDVGSI